MDTPIVTPKKICVDCGAPIANYYALRCRVCGNNLSNKARRKMPADYHALAAQHGYQWLGPEVQDTNQKTNWRCALGHEWSIRYSALRGCPGCNHHGDEDYHALAASKDCTWLGPTVKSVANKTRWRCAQGHEWETSYTSLRGCKACWHQRLGDSSRRPPADYSAIAESIGLVWLGPEVSSTSIVTRWQCEKGHVWNACYATLLKGRTCAECSKLQPEDYRAVATSRGFLWVGTQGKSGKVKTEWQCAEGHRWFATFNNVSRGSGCPLCLDYINGVRASKQQRALREMMGGVLNYKAGRYSIDIALLLPSANIACEYDAYYWHANQQERDSKRTQWLMSKGWKVLRVKSGNLLPSAEQLSKAIAALVGGIDYHEIVLADWGTE